MWGYKRRLMGKYEHFMESYDELHHDEQKNKYAVALSEVSPTEDDVIADFGCGTGLFLRYVSKRVKKAVGIDLSRRQLLWAKEKMGGDCYLIQADLEKPPFRKGVFDHVFSFTVFHHLKKLEETIGLLTSFARENVVISILKSSKAADEAKLVVNTFKNLKLIDLESLKDLIIFISLSEADS
ncbi:MAG: class I SAM-dependent methyltransferase [Candidatus Geothermarchaeales archaeon]